MKIFNTPKRFDCFPIPLENSWAWDSQFWEHVVDKLIPSLNKKELALAKTSINQQLNRIDLLLKTGGISERENKFKELPVYAQYLAPLELIIINIEKLENSAIRSEKNMQGMKQILSILLQQIENTQQTNNSLEKGACIITNTQKLHNIRGSIKQQIKEVSNQLFEGKTKA